MGFKASDSDAGLYITEGNVYIVVYVDDILTAAKDMAAIISTKQKLFDIASPSKALPIGKIRLCCASMGVF
ncbi:hypothetical protein WJX77_010287 [Trebouxia sp. C0004]